MIDHSAKPALFKSRLRFLEVMHQILAITVSLNIQDEKRKYIMNHTEAYRT